MKSAILYGPSEVKIEEVDLPLPGPGEVLVRVDTALTCGTDVKVFLRGGHPRMISPPAPFGHEFAGVVEKTGEGAEGFVKGDRVTAANSAPCGGCYFCRRGLENLCDDLLFINGAYAEYILIPSRIVEKNLLHVPAGLPFQAAALSEPLACVLHGASLCGINPGDTVLINGAGPIGLLFIQAAKLAGAFVLSSDPDEGRRSLALSAGADRAFGPEEGGAASALGEMTAGLGVDVAIDAAGVPASWEAAAGAVRKGGLALFFGGCAPGTTVTLDTCLLHYSQITTKGVFHHTPYFFEKALRLLAAEKIVPGGIITDELPLSSVGEALVMMTEKKSAKVAIRP